MIELDVPSPASREVKAVWQGLAEAHRHLAELKGLCESLPNRAILLDTLAIQEAKDSSEIENIITTVRIGRYILGRIHVKFAS